MYEIMVELAGDANKSAIDKARAIIKEQYVVPPKALDMFGGGGTIPLEIANIGAKAYSIDANELSVFIQKANLEYSQKVDLRSAEDIVRKSGIRVLKSLEEATNELFPLRKGGVSRSKQGEISETKQRPPVVYFWTYSLKCPKCKYVYYLIKRPWLSRKKNKRIAIIINNSKDRQHIGIKEVDDKYEHNSNWEGRNGSAKCPKCSHIVEKVDISNTRDELIAFVKRKEKSGKEFLLIENNDLLIPSAVKISHLENDLLKSLESSLPNTKLPKWSGIVNPSVYGIETHSDFVNKRQRVVLLSLIKCLKDEYRLLKEQNSKELADFAISVLASLIDQLVDWNCRLSMWISQNEQMGRAFCGPGVPMLWDYGEIDPIMNGPANLWDKLDRIISGISSIEKFPYKPEVNCGIAQNLPFKSNYFDAIITDPPYYDNIYYSILADFFYAWKRILLKNVDPDLFNKQDTSFGSELVASAFRSQSALEAHDKYCLELGKAIKEAERVLKYDGVLSFIYSHSSLGGWDAIIRAFRDTNFIITSVQPLSIERKARPRGMTSEAIDTCITFVCHKTMEEKSSISFPEIIAKVSSYVSDYGNVLKEAGWSEKDIGLAIFAQGIGLLVNYKNITGGGCDADMIMSISDYISTLYSGFKITKRKSL
ncbi:MAG: DUF1156 domain-containing protein [Candidatus Omnitrophica bacterium]|nr:DUF1156 domain-containing protein [Candidatus Omnitrophota bacterium]